MIYTVMQNSPFLPQLWP